MSAPPFAAEVAKAVTQGSMGDRTYLEGEEYVRELCECLLALGWKELQWPMEPGATWTIYLESSDKVRTLLIVLYTSALLPQIDVEIFHRKKTK